MKLSKAQQLVVSRLADGWELGVATGLYPMCWMQSDGIGCGGEHATVSLRTMRALRKRGVITIQVNHKHSSYSTTIYVLTTGLTKQQ